jgi:hypothetical protein
MAARILNKDFDINTLPGTRIFIPESQTIDCVDTVPSLPIMPGGIHPPLEVIASWPAPNFHNPDTRPKTILILACVLGPMTVCLVLARLWVRIRMQNKAGMDDWLMIAALVSLSLN